MTRLRANDPVLCWLIRVCLVGSMLTFVLEAIAQDFARTDNQRIDGERTLVLTGLFSGADTAYVQVYHDGEELYGEMAVRTWSLTLGTHDYYVVKFTDSRHREKRLYVVELSDNLVEFYPPIEIDFDRQGNLVLLKQSSGKPDWQEFDVGMSRRRVAGR